MNAPAVTVLMPFHNASAHLGEAVDSILAQDWTDFELLAIDDGSTDDGSRILSARADPRIRLEQLPRNKGVIAALNCGLALARGEFVARMDADDIAEPARLGRQLAYLREHPDVGVLGTSFTPFGENHADTGWVRWHEPEDIRIALLFENPLCHPTVMMRRSALAAVGNAYPTEFSHAEEYALWLRLAAHTRFANLPESLLRYRVHPGQISRKRSETQSASIDRLVGGQLDTLGLPKGRRDLRIHHLLGAGFFPRPGLAAALRAWTATLADANALARVYDQTRFVAQLDVRREAALRRHDTLLSAMPVQRRLKWRLSSWWNAMSATDPR